MINVYSWGLRGSVFRGVGIYKGLGLALSRFARSGFALARALGLDSVWVALGIYQGMEHTFEALGSRA